MQYSLNTEFNFSINTRISFLKIELRTKPLENYAKKARVNNCVIAYVFRIMCNILIFSDNEKNLKTALSKL